MTLIEVIASLAILGTVLIGLVIAKAKHKHQSALAIQRIEACQIAEQILQDWWSSSDGVPEHDSGDIKGKPDWKWQTSILPGPELVESHSRPYQSDQQTDETSGALALQIIRLEILSPDDVVLASAELISREQIQAEFENDNDPSPILSIR